MKRVEMFYVNFYGKYQMKLLLIVVMYVHITDNFY